GKPIQLVHVSPDGSLLLKENVLRQCFLRSDVRETPLCVVAIVGERRKGKSFLLNYLLRKLSKMDIWMSDDEPLRGFEWQPGTETMTKGVFIWSRPLFLETQEGKARTGQAGNSSLLAVFLVDTEGSVDLSRETELSVKLSALSVFLSSHMVNCSCRSGTLPLAIHCYQGSEWGLSRCTLWVASWEDIMAGGGPGNLRHLLSVKQRSIMPVPTQGMRRTVEQKEVELMSHVQGEVSQQDFQELSQFLGSERVKFLKEFILLQAQEEFDGFLHKQVNI
ncbi:RN112 protein, partial [Atractosteus spatula]|nr:RN112 protein [Atractosteus spatula]